MKTISKNKIDWRKIISILKNKGVIAYPTDTAYGLAADYFSSQALKKIFQIKKRPKEKKVALIAADIKQVKKYFSLNKTENSLAKKYWPGPLTLILKLKKGNKKVGVRVPDSEIAREIARRFKKPITATSANISTHPNCYAYKSVLNQFKNKKLKPDLIINAGTIKKVKPSTIILCQKNKIKIIRKGPIKL